jgi:hypothetical protein
MILYRRPTMLSTTKPTAWQVAFQTVQNPAGELCARRILGPFLDLDCAGIIMNKDNCHLVQMEPCPGVIRTIYLPRGEPDEGAAVKFMDVITGTSRSPTHHPCYVGVAARVDPACPGGIFDQAMIAAERERALGLLLCDSVRDSHGIVRSFPGREQLMQECGEANPSFIDNNTYDRKLKRLGCKHGKNAGSDDGAPMYRTLRCSLAVVKQVVKELDMGFGNAEKHSWQIDSGRFSTGVIQWYPLEPDGLIWVFTRCPKDPGGVDSTSLIVDYLIQHGATTLNDNVLNLWSVNPWYRSGKKDAELDRFLRQFV